MVSQGTSQQISPLASQHPSQLAFPQTSQQASPLTSQPAAAPEVFGPGSLAHRGTRRACLSRSELGDALQRKTQHIRPLR